MAEPVAHTEPQAKNVVDRTIEAVAKRDPKTLVGWGEKEKTDFRKVAQGVWEKWSKKSPLAKEIYESQLKFLKSLGKL